MEWISIGIQLLGGDLEGSLPGVCGSSYKGSPVLIGSDGRICADFADGWGVYESLVVHLDADGAQLIPNGIWVDGRMSWSGDGWTLKYSPYHQRWILFTGDYRQTPRAYQKWNSDEYEGDGWYECNDPIGSFTPRGIFLNSDVPDKTVIVKPMKRWMREDDGKSVAPAGFFKGENGATGTIAIGVPRYMEGATVWTRTLDGRKLASSMAESTSGRLRYTGIGYGYGIERGEYLYFSDKIFDSDNDLVFAPYVWDEESRSYVSAGGSVEPVTLAFAGLSVGQSKTIAYLAEPVVLR